jgi:acetyl esterase
MMTGVPPRDLHPDAATLIDTFIADGLRPYDQLSVLAARSMVAGSTRLQGERAEIARVEDLLVEHGTVRVPVRLYDPAPGADPPVVCYFHGGGFVTGSVAVADRACRALAAASGWSVLSVECDGCTTRPPTSASTPSVRSCSATVPAGPWPRPRP